MPVPLEHIGDGSTVDRNFQTLQRLVLDTGGITAGIRFGTVEFTFTADTISATETVAHGLGRIPAAVWVASWWIDGGAKGYSPVRYDNLDATDFQCRGEAGPAYTAFTDTVTTSWVVIG
jgi:hypothetical protein